MVWFIIGIVLGVLGIGAGVFLLVQGEWKKYAKIPFIIAGAIMVMFTFFGSMVTVKTGYTGVVTTMGKVKEQTLDAGFSFKSPFDKVVQMDNRVQKGTEELMCFSSDIQEAHMVYTINYQIDKQNAQVIYKTIGKDYYNIVIKPNVAEATKIATAKYTAEQIVQKRDELVRDIENILISALSTHNINVVSTAIEDIDFSDTFTSVVEAKQVAEQKKKQAEIEQAQALLQAENDKKIATTNAQAQAEVAKIQAEADKEVAKIGADSAEYQGKKDASIALQKLASINGWTVIMDDETGINKIYKADGKEVTDEELKTGAEYLINYYLIQQWNGELPETYVGNDSVLSLIKIIDSEETE